MCYATGVRVVLAMLLGLLLAGTNVFSAQPDVLDAPDAPSCACIKCTCLCDAPASAPVPLTPAQPAPQPEVRSLAVVHVLFVLNSLEPKLSVPPVSLAPTSSSAVPVYQRNCIFLI